MGQNHSSNRGARRRARLYLLIFYGFSAFAGAKGTAPVAHQKPGTVWGEVSTRFTSPAPAGKIARANIPSLQKNNKFWAPGVSAVAGARPFRRIDVHARKTGFEPQYPGPGAGGLAFPIGSWGCSHGNFCFYLYILMGLY